MCRRHNAVAYTEMAERHLLVHSTAIKSFNLTTYKLSSYKSRRRREMQIATMYA